MGCFPAGTLMQPGQVLLIARDGRAYLTYSGIRPDFEFLPRDATIPDLAAATDWASGTFDLSLFGDEVLLLDGNRSLVDALSWGSSDFAFSPPIQLASLGTSYERYPPGRDRNSAADWRFQEAPNPGRLPE